MGDINIFKCNADSVSIGSLCRCKCLKNTEERAIAELEKEEKSPEIKKRKSLSFVDDDIDFNVKKTKFVEYDDLMTPNSSFVILSKEGMILAYGGPMIPKVFLNKKVCESSSIINKDVNIVWRKGYLNIFYTVYKKLIEGSRPQVGATINGDEYKICGNYTKTKRNHIDSVMIVLRPVIASVSEIDEMYLTTDDSPLPISKQRPSGSSAV